MGRFTPTPLVADLPVMGRTVCLETNSEAVLDQTLRAFKGYSDARDGEVRFRWRLVVDSGAGLQPLSPMITAFSGQGLRCVNLGQRGFMAIDLEAHLAVCFLPEGLVRDETAFCSLLLETLLVMTADALGLTPLPAACVAWSQHALLVFQEPETEGLLRSTPGRRRPEDQAGFITFLEFVQGRLLAWEGFRQLGHAPQLLEGLVGASGNRAYDASEAEGCFFSPRKTSPLACVFLDPVGQGPTRIIRLDEEAKAKRLESNCLIRREYSSNADSVLRMLGSLPAYCIKVGNEPGAITTLWRDLLSIGESPVLPGLHH